MGGGVHMGIPVIAEGLGFQTTNSVGLAKIVNEVINSFSISQILHLTDEAMMHHETTALIPTVTNLTRVSIPGHYIGFGKGRKIRNHGGVITGINKSQFFRTGNLGGKRSMQIMNFRSRLICQLNKHVLKKLFQEAIIFNGTTLSNFVRLMKGIVKEPLEEI